LRLATPSIVAGLRIATVTTIGLVTVTGLIGLGGYGSLINDGIDRQFSTPIVVGAALSVAMAIVLDVGLVGLERVTTPWARRKKAV
jgi:osmoprotectant transport system permease protein